MKKRLQIEIVPLTDKCTSSGSKGYYPLLPKGSSRRVINKTKNFRVKKDQYEARYILQQTSGKIVVAFERGKTKLQARKRLKRLLGFKFY